MCLEVNFRDGHDDPLDHVCLAEIKTCVYEGHFNRESSQTPVVVTKGCPLQPSGRLEMVFKCGRVKGLAFSTNENGDCSDIVLPEGAFDEALVSPLNIPSPTPIKRNAK